MQLLKSVKNISPAQRHPLNVWLISFYFPGIRVGDLLQLKWSDFIDDRLRYRMGKNQKLVSLKIPLKVEHLLDIYKEDRNSDLVFKELRMVNFNDPRQLRTRIKTATRNFNRRLSMIAERVGIEKKLSMHIARHSFGNISGNKIPIQMLQKLYRHSSVTTTIMYQSNFMQDDVDNALDLVLDF